MTKLYAGVAALALAAVIGGTAFWTSQMSETQCGVSTVAGATIGGEFELLTSDGTLKTDAEVIDQPALVYFGYSYCPDVCPFDVARNVAAVDILKEQGINVRPVFITIDPSRDTTEALADYEFSMHPDLMALTGTDEQVKTAAQAYKVYYARGEGDDDFYLMDHSTFTYLMMPGTGLANYFKREDTPEGMAETTACLIQSS